MSTTQQVVNAISWISNKNTYNSKFSKGVSNKDTTTATMLLLTVKADFKPHRYSICWGTSSESDSTGIVRNTNTLTEQSNYNNHLRKLNQNEAEEEQYLRLELSYVRLGNALWSESNLWRLYSTHRPAWKRPCSEDRPVAETSASLSDYLAPVEHYSKLKLIELKSDSLARKEK